MAAEGRALLALLLLQHDGGADGREAGRLGRLAGGIANAVLEGIDPDIIAERLDLDRIAARLDIDAILDRIDVGRLLERIDVADLAARLDAQGIADRIDPQALVDRVDPQTIVDRVDPQTIVDRVDPQTIVARVDPNGILDRVDPDALLDRVDIDRLLDRVDVDRFLDRVDVDRFLARVDVDALLDRLDVNALLDRLDVNAVLDRVDVDRLLGRADLEALVRQARIPELVAESTQQVAGSVLDVVRKQLVALDVLVMRGLLTVLRRDPDALPAGPPALVGDAVGDAPTPSDDGAAPEDGDLPGEVTGHYAGILAQVGAHVADVAIATSVYTAALGAGASAINAVFGDVVDGGIGAWWVVGYAVWLFAYVWVPTTIAGRTLAMGILGLRIVARDGNPLRGRTALWRTLLLPLATLPFGIGFLVILLDREQRALHDRLAGSAVVYDWGGRSARLPTPLGRFLTERGTR